MLSSWFDAGGKREAGDGEADKLTLTAAEATDGIAHEKDLGEVVAAQGGSPECLAGTEPALDRNTVTRVQPEVWDMAVRRVRVFFSSARVELILEFHLQRWLFSGAGGRSKSFSGVRRGLVELRGVRME
jgi:hypothetical protein